MSEPVDETAESIRRALDAAEAANEAAQDIANLSAAHRTFAEAVMKGQRRNTLFATGAAAGAMVAIAMGGLVYFRSVADLRVAAAVQSEAAALLVEELMRMDGIGDAIEAQQETMRLETLDLLEKVKDEIRRAALEGDAPPEEDPAEGLMSAQVATEIREGVKADVEAVRDEILQAIVESGMAGGGTDTGEVAALLADVKALLEKGAGAGRPAEAPAPAPARSSKPKPKPAVTPEPDPFTYP